MRGHTLIELLFVLFLIGVTAAAVTPAARTYRDRAAVSAAREAVVGLLTEARLGGVERGSGAVRIVPSRGQAESVVGDSAVRSIDLASDFGVDVRIGGSPDTVEIRYDALGLGRVASRTIVFVRGEEAGELVVSAFGRVRRR
jgi:prepilin-type N-terminal cleavage/methylation domain-containing protein